MMKSLSKIRPLACALALGLSSLAFFASAKPADPRPRIITQPDGTSLSVTLHGDEHCHFYTTADGHLLSRVDDAYYLASATADGLISPSPWLAHEPSLRSAGESAFLRAIDRDALAQAIDSRARLAPMRQSAPSRAAASFPGLYPWKTFPSTGDHKVLVILVDFPDVPFNLDNPYDYFNAMLNEPGFSEYDGTGSVADYFRENSMDVFRPDFTLFGPVTMSQNHEYYGANDMWGTDLRPYEMVIEACQALDDTVDFSEYDSNNDGLIDNVYIYYAGLGESGEGDPDTIWPHAWNVSYGTDTPYYFDGVRLDRYACSNEWEYGLPDGIGTFVHEFSHVLGLPDLYATTYGSAYTPGPWSIMDTGVYNNNARTPPYMSGFERLALGWLQPKIIDGPADIVIEHVAANEAYVIPTASDNEYFVLENRQKQGWDKYLPGHGMLVWHIDYSSRVWYDNAVNNTASHQRVDLEEADASKGDKRSGQTFPGTKKVTSFTDDTTPSMRCWNKDPLNLPIENITEADGLISFIVAGGHVDYAQISLSEATDVKAGSFCVAWTPDPAAKSYAVTVVAADASGSDGAALSPVPEWTRRDVGDVTSTIIDGLSPETTYYVYVEATNGYGFGAPSNTVQVTTAEATLDVIVPEALEPTDVTDSSFVAHWMRHPLADRYNLYVYTKELADCRVEKCDFTGGVTNMPEGWSSTSTLSYANDAYTGDAAPALRLSMHNANITTCTYDEEVLWIEFWQRGSNVTDESRIKVQVQVGDVWSELASLPITTVEGGERVRVDSLPEGTNAVRLSFHTPTGQGSLAIDDIMVGWGGVYTAKMLADYDGVCLGDVDSVVVSSLQPSQTYYYRVIASDGTLASRPSAEIKVKTLSHSGITDITAAATAEVVVAPGWIYVAGRAGEPVNVCDVMGRMVASATVGADGRCQIPVSVKGVLIVRAGAASVKVRM